MQGIYTYIPETNNVLMEYSVAAILSILFMVSISLVPALALLYFYVRTFRSMCAVPIIIIIIIIIIIVVVVVDCNWAITRWQWLFHMYTCIQNTENERAQVKDWGKLARDLRA